jgi:hypothetical protein
MSWNLELTVMPLNITDLAGFAGGVSMYKFKFLTGWGCDHT